jgi:para-nitrobenzyl esterase
MNRVGWVIGIALGIISAAALSNCGGSNSTPPPPACANTSTIACTQSGAVQGVVVGNLVAFRGIPFAAPPVGNLRWKAPQPPVSWQGVRDASTFGNVCPQINSAGVYAGDEDCLVLNVFVSQTPPNHSQPVMVFFHGGGNVNGDTQYTPTSLDAPPLADQGVVVVTAEYRLGLLGTLATPQLTAEGGGTSGAYILLDMIAALTWVKQNIAAFGGDPTHVMLFGQSAGSFNIQILFAAPGALGLYSSAGMESGAVPLASTTTWFLSFADVQAKSPQLISDLGCAGAADVLACLRAVPAETIVNYQFQVPPTQLPSGPGIGNPVAPMDSILYLQQNGAPVPLLIGSNREEWSIRDSPTAPLDAAGYATAVHQRFDPLGAGVANQVLALYPAASYATPAYALIAVDGDYQLTCELRTAARAAITAANHKPVWRYLYTHTFENDPNLAVFGAFHTAELFFLFGNFNDGLQPGGGVVYNPSQADLTFSQALMGYWTRFAATGNPNGAGAVAWPEYDPNTDSMLELDDTFAPINGYHNPQCDYLTTLTQP